MLPVSGFCKAERKISLLARMRERQRRLTSVKKDCGNFRPFDLLC